MTNGPRERSNGSTASGPGASPLPVVGWKEWVSLPDMGLEWVKAKIDTGARSSALHATDIELFSDAGTEMVRFTTHPWQESLMDAATFELPVVDTREVRSSTGHSQIRAVIQTDVTIAGSTFVTEFTLTDRTSMGLRMLIGRQALHDRFVVDSGRAYLVRKAPRLVRDRNRAV